MEVDKTCKIMHIINMRATWKSMYKSSAFDLELDSRMGGLAEWLKYVKDDIGDNLMSKKELAKSISYGALSGGLAGLGLGALFARKKGRRRKIIKTAIIGALLGGASGPAYAQLRKYLDGIPFDNSQFDKSKLKKGEKVYIGVGGSANGEGHSWFIGNMRRGAGRDKVYALRHVDYDKLEDVFNDLSKRGLDVTLVGHSSGGATVGKFLRAHPEAKGILLDPVSWTGRGVPENAVVFTPDHVSRDNPVFENYVAKGGGRWLHEGNNAIMYNGDHSDNSVFTDYLFPLMQKGLDPKDLLSMRDSKISSRRNG